MENDLWFPKKLNKEFCMTQQFDFEGQWDYRTSTGLRKQTLGGHKQKRVCTRTQKKGAVTLQETEPDLPVSVQESLEASAGRGLPWRKGHWIQESWHKSSWRRLPSPPLPHHSLASAQTKGKEHSPTHQQKNFTRDLMIMASPIRTRPRFPHSQSLPSGSFHKLLILIP